MEKDKDKYLEIEVTKSMCKKVGAIKPGDKILVSCRSNDKPKHGEYVLVSHFENQWIEKYWKGLTRRYKNIYLIVRVTMY